MASPTKQAQERWTSTGQDDVLQIVSERAGGSIVGGIDYTGTPFGNLGTGGGGSGAGTAGATTLAGDTDVSIVSPVNGQALVYDSGTSLWKNATVGSGGGTTWYTGSGAPSTLHNNGDFYLNTSNGDIYEQVTGSWGSPIENIKGASGATGATGPTGAQGPAGASYNFADAEVPSGSTPGTSFTLAYTPSPAASLILVWTGVTLKSGGVDFTLSGASLTMTQTVQAGDSFICWYRY